MWLLSIAAAGVALFARTKSKHGDSVTYFGSIAGWTIAQYRDQLNAMTPELLAEDFVGQIHGCSEICARKHFWTNVTLVLFFSSVSVLVLTYLLRAWNG